MRELEIISKSLWLSFNEKDLEFIRRVDDARLDIERSRLPEHRRQILDGPAYSLRRRFEMWESLVNRMDSDWPPDRHYMVDEYLNDLESRSNLGALIADSPLATRAKLERALSAIDAVFLRNTIEDGGAELGRWRKEPSAFILPMLWQRRPRDLPW